VTRDRSELVASRLTGRVAIVTGAGSHAGLSIGLAVSVRLAQEGAAIVVVDLDQRRADRTVAEVVAVGGSALPVLADVAEDSDCEEAVDAALRGFGRLDILVNNAGVTGGGRRLEDFELADWERTMAVNLRGPLLMSRHAVPELAKRSGTVVNIASVSGLRAGGSLAYGPSKAGLIQLTRELCVLYGRQGIRVNSIAPGHLPTPIVGDMNEATLRRRRLIAPLGVDGSAWDVAATAAFLASNDARFVSGVCVPVDGGVTAMAALTGVRMLDDQ
jgi:NAD(P)-dependent dehydrogenase (short-subunit alcohol dehydrogenase family)